jgi:hypothetical protein
MHLKCILDESGNFVNEASRVPTPSDLVQLRQRDRLSDSNIGAKLMQLGELPFVEDVNALCAYPRDTAVELTPADLREIDGVTSKIQLQGARYPEKLEKMTGR